jgi:hypothetical protein
MFHLQPYRSVLFGRRTLHVRHHRTMYRDLMTSVYAAVQAVSRRRFSSLRHGFSSGVVHTDCLCTDRSKFLCRRSYTAALGPAWMSCRVTICTHPVLNPFDSFRNLGQCILYHGVAHFPLLRVTIQKPRIFIWTEKIRQFKPNPLGCSVF